MATVTIRRLPDEVVERAKAAAGRNNRSMEQELRQLIERSYPAPSELREEIRQSWTRWEPPSADEIDEWIETGRP